MVYSAGLKTVVESVQESIKYYGVNVNGTLVLVESMKKVDIKSLIFSSLTTVYGEPEHIALTE